MRKRILSLLFGAALWLALPPAAEAMRCGNDLVSEGDLALEVRQVCGEPDDLRVHYETRLSRIYRHGRFIEAVEEVEVEEWLYNLGPYQFIRILRFENGRLAEIETGDYGY
jgi:hypothetical protein